ncbi:mechanosensitive ion channel family protein [Pannus brasiliensis CCIBt3594]|uniref:Mechanosensitive ion channel family protein n=2 Tax=Pannus TaxID=1427526 RepID=A0AAW9QR93_9CHRO
MAREFFFWLLLVSLVFLLTQVDWAFFQGNQPAQALVPGFVSKATIERQGNIEYGYVTLDGKQLFPVTANVTSGNTTTDLSPVQARIESIETTIYRLLKRDFSPQNFYVTVASLDRQTVILAGDPTKNIQEIILTVTELDSQFEGKPVSVLAKNWAWQLQQALLQAREDRRPEARQHQIFQAASIGIASGIISLALYGVHRWIYSLFDRRKQQLLQSAEEQLSLDLATPGGDINQNFQRLQALKQRQMLNLFLRRSLRLIQLVVWGVSLAGILLTFPETRSWGETLIAFTLKLFIIILSMLAAANISHFFVNQRLKSLVEEASIKPDEMQRMILRTPTLASGLNEILKFTAWCLAIAWLINWEQVPIGALWTGAGLLSVALSLVFQNLLRDWLNGFLIIFGDYYAVGDVVKIADTTGLVEAISLRSTKIRGDGGSLTTIPHGQVTTIRNLTKDWSRVDFSVIIARDADLAYAMQVMKRVAEDMASDPEWRLDILEPVSLIGVECLSASGTQISLWIKTKRSKQWTVERAFRYRLKQAFEREEIPIG